MAITYADGFALVNVAMAKITTKENAPKVHCFVTASEVSAEPVSAEGEEKSLRVKNVVYATNRTEDIVKGYDVKLSDNRFTPEVFALIDGGVLTKEDESGKYTYKAPVAGAAVARTKFDLTIYTEVKSGEAVVGYMEITWPDCVGKPISPTFQDGEFFAPEMNVQSRAAAGESPMVIKELASLPTD